MRLAIVGSGYVGLVSGACFADFGHSVACVDHDSARVAALQSGVVPIYEPGLEQLVELNVRSGRLTFTEDLETAVRQAEVVFIAVGTPSRRGDGYADLSYVFAAAAEIAKAISGFTAVVVKSTVPVGTGDDVERIIRQTNPYADFVVVSNPEFLREGAAIDDFKHPDRIVIGIQDERARDPMVEVYRPLYLNQSPILFTSRRTAELAKYAANAFLAMKVTFINEMADLCEKVGANVQDISRGIGLDKRIGPKFLNAGPGYGGSCFPKDTTALVKTAQDYESPLRLVETTVAVNEQRRRAMGRKVIAACGDDVRGKRIGMLGLTFKPNTDDIREAPAHAIAQVLLDAGARVRAFDPKGMGAAETVFSGVEMAANAYDAAADAECLVLVTEWNEFRSLDLQRLKQTMAVPRFVDLRNVYRAARARAARFQILQRGPSGCRRFRLRPGRDGQLAWQVAVETTVGGSAGR